MTDRPNLTPAPLLRRELGRWDLTAIGINQVIGGAVFLMPSQIASQVGNWSPIAFLAAGLTSLLVALCFAEVGSRFESTGGPYLYARAAFGSFVAFEIGWMQWFTRASSLASIVNGIALALAFYWPGMSAGGPRAILITAVTIVLTVINVRGIKHGARLVNWLTISKLAPLALFILAGMWSIDWSRLTELPPITPGQVASAGLLLIFAYGGFDVIGIPAGEARDPRRHVPFAFIVTIAAVTLIMTSVQIIVMSVLPNVAESGTPMADAAFQLMGSFGALAISVGTVLSMAGNNAGQVLAGSRVLFALAEHRVLPAFFARVHPQYQTPANAIWFTSTVALVLALYGSFTMLLAASAVARLLTYTGVSIATLRLRQHRFAHDVRPAAFVVPFGPLVPLLATLVSLVILVGASATQLIGGAAALAAGAILYLLSSSRRDSVNEAGIMKAASISSGHADSSDRA